MSYINSQQLEFCGYELLSWLLSFLAIIWCFSQINQFTNRYYLWWISFTQLSLLIAVLIYCTFIYRFLASCCDGRYDTRITLPLQNVKATVTDTMVKWKEYLLMGKEVILYIWSRSYRLTSKQFCWHTSSTTSRNEKFLCTTQHIESKHRQGKPGTKTKLFMSRKCSWVFWKKKKTHL